MTRRGNTQTSFHFVRRGVLCVSVVASAAIVAACEDPWPEVPPISTEAFEAGHAEWHQGRRDGLVEPPFGPLLWIGLWELAEGETTFGSDPSHPVVLPEEDSPATAGRLYRVGQEVEIEPMPGAGVGIRSGDPIDRSSAGTPLTERIVFENDRSEAPTELTIGSLGIRLHAERGTDRLWLRAWDEDAPARDSFALPEYYPLDRDWRVMARYEPYEEPRVLPVSDVKDGTVEVEAPGELVFRIGGEEHRLIATAGESSRDFFVLLWDETGLSETYEGMRYIHVPFPDAEGWTRSQPGWTVIDFNRTYSPPCAFTAYSVCAYPPRENRLAFAITAGEKKP